MYTPRDQHERRATLVAEVRTAVGESKGRDKEGYTPLVRKAKITRLIFNANLPSLHTD